MQQVTIGVNQAGQRFDKYLHKLMPNAGTGFLYKMLRKKNITLNGKKAEGKEILQTGDQVAFFFSDETYAAFTGNNEVQNNTNNILTEYMEAYQKLKGITIIYEDSNILILNKPAGILTQKARPEDYSLNEWLIGYLVERDTRLADELSTFKPSVCNRLDRNTSGIVLCGKSLKGSQYLSRIIKDRSISKYYHTICVGEITASQRIEGYLIKDEKTNTVKINKTASGEDKENYIQTAYFPLKTAKQYSLLEVELITGKSHQIRAHLASIKHPLIGDTKYGYPKTNQIMYKNYHLNYQLLHAYRITFPSDEESQSMGVACMTCIAPYTQQFERIMNSIFN